MRENVVDKLCIFNEADDPHTSLAFPTDKEIKFMNPLNQPYPGFTESFTGKYAVAAEDIESKMFPRRKSPDHFFD